MLADRDWTHPQGGGTGANLYGQVSRWVAWGHRVSIVASGYPGGASSERIGELEIHRLGGRSTLFPRAIWRQWRGLVPDADVVLEVVNGITFLTPLWLRTPTVTLLHHVHRSHYVEEMGRPGALAALLLETLPLKLLYRRARFATISEATADEIAALGLDRDRIAVNYLGVELDAFAPGRRSAEPTLLFLGRLKRYKRIEVLLDVLEEIPEAVLDIAGDGDHRPQLEAEIEHRSLTGRVRMHGHVTEERKLELLQGAWVNMTASSAEGWCLTVMEAAACSTPSVALDVGGLPESIAHGRTGLLAHDIPELVRHTAQLVRDGDSRERLGRQALERARDFTWDSTARRTLDLLEEAHARGIPAAAPGEILRDVARSDTGRAAGLATAVIASNAIALAFTIVFARLLGADGYGSLAALLSAFIILMVPGSALQVAVAREVSTAVADGTAAGAGVRRWVGRLLAAALAVAVVAAAGRSALAAAIGVESEWAAAAVPVTAMLWAVLSVQRGALQGLRRYRPLALSVVAEAGLRLAFGLLLVAAGLGVTGAFLGTAVALATLGVVLWALLEPLLPKREAAPSRLRDLLAQSWAPVLGLTLLFALQEVHVIVMKHEASADVAGSWAVAAVAAKAIIWVAVGLGLYLLPEAARRSREGGDARPVLARTLALIAAAALPLVAVFALLAEPLLAAVFGEDLTGAAGALPWLGMAMALLACAYLSVQYLLALGQASFIWVLGVAATAEIALLAVVGTDLTTAAVALMALQLLCAGALLGLSLRRRSIVPTAPPTPAPIA